MRRVDVPWGVRNTERDRHLLPLSGNLHFSDNFGWCSILNGHILQLHIDNCVRGQRTALQIGDGSDDSSRFLTLALTQLSKID
jgi:hypothetical protein